MTPNATLSSPLSTANTESTAISYRVQAGDTLFSIARRFGINVEQLKSQNQLSGNALQVGQTLKEKFPYILTEDRNELPDDIVFGN